MATEFYFIFVCETRSYFVLQNGLELSSTGWLWTHNPPILVQVLGLQVPVVTTRRFLTFNLWKDISYTENTKIQWISTWVLMDYKDICIYSRCSFIYSRRNWCQEWWHKPVIPALRKLNRKEYKSQASLWVVWREVGVIGQLVKHLPLKQDDLSLIIRIHAKRHRVESTCNPHAGGRASQTLGAHWPNSLAYCPAHVQ